MKICSVKGCKNKVLAKGLCGTHYSKKYRKGVAKECEVEGCDNKAMGNKAKYCTKHKTQIERYGKILSRTRFHKNEITIKNDVAFICLYNKRHEQVSRAKIDIEDIDLVKNHKWHLGSNGYVETKINRKTMSMHNIVMHNIPVKKQYDHISRDKVDNRKWNLREATKSQNGMNVDVRANNTSGVTGVHWRKDMGKWCARIKKCGKTIYLGSYKNKEDAVSARIKAELKLFDEFSPLTQIERGKHGDFSKCQDSI